MKNKFTLLQGGSKTKKKSRAQLTLIKGGKGMIELSNNIFRNEHFKTGFMKLGQADVTHKAHYSIKRIMDKIQQQASQIDPEEQRIRKQYLVTEILADGSSKSKWADEKAANEEFKNLYEQSFQIEVTKLPIQELEHIKLSTGEWDALAPIIES